MRKFYYTFQASEVDGWQYCPMCGEELIEIYSGDYHGSMMCPTDFCDVYNTDFTVTWEDE